MKQYKILTLLTALCALFCASCVEYEDPALYTPTVTTGSVDPFSITRTEGTITATITSPDVKTIKKAGFRYSLYETMEVPTEVKCDIESQGIKASLSNLETGKTYYYYAFASGGFNEVRGQVQSFTTKQYDAPALGKVTLSDLGENSLHASSSLIDNGGDDLSNAGFVYRVCSMTEPDPVPSLTGEGWQVAFYKNFAFIGNGSSFTNLIENLVPDTEYALCAFATNKALQTGYSEVVRFRTQEHYDVPQVAMAVKEDVTETSMSLSSSVISKRGLSVSKRGFCYSTTNTAPTIDDIHREAEGDDEGFQIRIENLTSNQTYYVRAYATNEKGTGYSDAAIEVTTLTPDFFLATIGEITMSEVKEISSVATASIIDKGNTEVVFSGFYLSRTNSEPNKNEYDQFIPSESGSDDVISATIKGLVKNTTYYLRAFVSNAVGIAYSSTKVFTTANYVAPTVAAVVEEGAGNNEVTVSSSVSYNGGIEVTERGFCYSRTNSMPTLADNYVGATGTDASFQATITKLMSGRTYYIRAYAKNERGTSYSNSALEVHVSGDDPFNGHDYVDLGLKDSEGNTIYWATCNVGADTPEDYGLYFAWGETVGYAQSDSHVFDWAHYSLCGGSSSTMKKYCIDSSFGTVDNKTVLEPADDAATQNWGGNWRIPTRAEQDQLRNSCTWTWNSAKKGYTVKGKNGNSIFLPAAGVRTGSGLNNVGSSGFYWSSSLSTSGSDRAYCRYFASYGQYADDSYRWSGESVRAVCVAIE